jgi:hypothetical protein
MELNEEIDELDRQALSDSTAQYRGLRFRLALRKLDRLLAHASRMVRVTENEEAKDLMDQAFEARRIAVEAAEEEDWETAFDSLKESAYLAIEAVKLVRDEFHEKVEEMMERLQEKFQEVRDLLAEVGDLVEQDQGQHPWAGHLFKRAVHHLHLAELAALERRPRKAFFHLRRAGQLGNLARCILEGAEQEPL